MNTAQNKGGRWVPAIPLRAPWDVRLRCEHSWTPHVHNTGQESSVDWDCTRCGATTENAARPADGRSWLGRLIYGRSA